MNQELKEKLTQVIQAANLQSGREPSSDLVRSLNIFIKLASEASLLWQQLISQHLATIESDSGLGFICVCFGSEVEGGADPKTVLPILREHWINLCLKLSSHEEEQTLIGMEFIAMALVACLSRCTEERERWSKDEHLVAQASDFSVRSLGAQWLFTLLDQHSDELLLIHVSSGVAVRVRYYNFSRCMHLFTLLQGAIAHIMPGSSTPSQHILSIAQGDKQEDCFDEAWWHYAYPSCTEPSFLATIFAETHPRDFERVDGQQVILLWPPVMGGRSWNSSMFTPFLEASPPRVEYIERLSKEETLHWYRKLQLKNPNPETML